MTKLEKAAIEHRNIGKESSEKIVFSWTNTDCVEQLQEKAFCAGVLWLFEHAKQITIDDMNKTTAKKLPDMRAMELVRRLEGLCQSEDYK